MLCSSGLDSVQWDMINIVEKGKRILQKHLEIFAANGMAYGTFVLYTKKKKTLTNYLFLLLFFFKGLCPNKCGKYRCEIPLYFFIILF